MEKEPGNRYHDISDVRIDLEKVLAEPGGAAHPVTASASRKYRWVAAAVVLIAILAVASIWNFESKPPLEPPPVISFSCELPREHMLDSLNLTEPMLAVSPDGKKFVYCTPKGIFLRTLDDLEAKLIPGTGEYPEQPFFSPDGEWIGYWSAEDRKLKKIRVSGKMPTTISRGEPAMGFLSWNADDTILYSAPDGIRRISANAVDTGKSELLIAPKTESLFTPRLLPGGKFVIFTMGTKEGYQIAVQSIQSGERKILTSGSDAYYLSTGHLIYMLDNDLVAIPFDLDTLEATGGPSPIISGILRTTGVPQFAVSEAGTIVYLPETPNEVSPNRTLVWVDKSGKEESLGAEPDAYSSPIISPDGTKAAVSVGALSTLNIKIWDLADRFMVQKTFENNNISTLPLWTRDGRRIVFYRQTRASFEIYSMPAGNGGGTATPIYSLQTKTVLPECWVDGKTLLITASTVGSGHSEIGVLSMNGGSPQWTPSQNERHNALQPRISPDRRWMAYTSTESGQYEVWVSRYPDVDKGRWKISKGGGNSPLWAPDGRALFYRNEDDVVMVLIDSAASGFSMGTPKSLFKGQYIRSSMSIGSYEQLRTWDISPDGRRFLMIKEDDVVAGRGLRKINVILNWLEDVRQKAPVK
jgi:Tol biopolymer transport system component